MHRRRVELVLDALEMIEPLDGVVELRALFLRELRFHLGNLAGEGLPVQLPAVQAPIAGALRSGGALVLTAARVQGTEIDAAKPCKTRPVSSVV